MGRYQENTRWLLYFAPFRALSVSAAYLTPFFLEKGFSLSEIFLLQSVFSLAFVLWEVPSGWLADRFGRAMSIKVSAPIAAVAMLAYGLSDHYWQFVVCELALALANGLISGADTALLYDSLKASDLAGQTLEGQFIKLSQRINAAGFAATAAGVPVAFVLVGHYGVSATVIADGALTLVGCAFAWRLREAPRPARSADAPPSAWQTTTALAGRTEVRWLVALGAVLSTATYVAFWLSAPYYEGLGIPAVWFGVILAGRSLWKAGLSRWYYRHRRLERSLWWYASLAGGVYWAMASGQWWLAIAVLGHDVVQALQSQPITGRLNTHISPLYRATLNSSINLVQRLTYSVAGPLVGLLVDTAGLSVGLMVTGSVCSLLGFGALLRLRRLGTFAGR